MRLREVHPFLSGFPEELARGPVSSCGGSRRPLPARLEKRQSRREVGERTVRRPRHALRARASRPLRPSRCQAARCCRSRPGRAWLSTALRPDVPQGGPPEDEGVRVRRGAPQAQSGRSAFVCSSNTTTWPAVSVHVRWWCRNVQHPAGHSSIPPDTAAVGLVCCPLAWTPACWDGIQRVRRFFPAPQGPLPASVPLSCPYRGDALITSEETL